MENTNYKSFKKGMGIRVEIPGDLDEFGNQKQRPGIIIKSYPSHVELQLFSTEKNDNHDYHSLKINNIKQYIRPIYYRTLPWNQVISKWIINEKEIYLSPNNPLFLKIAKNKVHLINDNFKVVHKKSKEKIKLLNKSLKLTDTEYEI